MKKLFEIKSKEIKLIDSKNYIFKIDNESYVDIYGKIVSRYTETRNFIKKNNESYDIWDSDFIYEEGLEEKLIAKSTIEPEWEIDDCFGNFGFKNKSGEFVIEPQYLYAYDFTCGLAAVNLNRTWFKDENGHRDYENHYGYINHRGETVIPFKFSEAYPFNIYGIAVVYSKWNSRGMIIDLNGNIIPKTNDYNFSHYYFYKQRFLSFSIKDDISDGFENEPAVGIYDTKERRVIVEPLLEDFDELNENLIRISEFGNHGISDFHEYYIDANGTVLFEGLKDKGFSIVGEPNKCNYSIVAINEYNGPVNADEGNTLFEGMSYILKRYYGVCSTDGEIIIPLDYDKIQELSENIFACYKNELITVFRI